MKFLKRFIPLIAISLATSCGGTKATAPKVGEWTVLVYMCGSNLESDYANLTTIRSDGQLYQWNGMGLAAMDIDEILAPRNKPNDVNIVLMTGGAKEWTTAKYGKYGSYDINASKLQIHHVKNNHQLQLDKSLTYQSMGDPSTLQSFLEYGLTYYPANKTALVLWNHGGGLQGVCFDEKTNDCLTATEVAEAVGNALDNCDMSGQKLEWIGYDACLMAVQDIAEINSQYFNYMVASQQLESGTGWDYDRWVGNLYVKLDTEEILKSICDSFIRDNNYPAINNDQTLAYYDLSYADEYKNAWENMADYMSKHLNYVNEDKFTSLIDDCHAFGYEIAPAYGLVDAKDFIDHLESSEAFNVSDEIMNPLQEAFTNLVPYYAKGKAAGNASGLSMYWSISKYTSYYNSYTEEDTNFVNWVKLVEEYGE